MWKFLGCILLGSISSPYNMGGLSHPICNTGQWNRGVHWIWSSYTDFAQQRGLSNPKDSFSDTPPKYVWRMLGFHGHGWWWWRRWWWWCRLGFLVYSFVFSMIMILWVRFVHACCVEYRFISQSESFPWTIAVIHYSHPPLSVNTNIIKNTNSRVLSRAIKFSRIPMERQQCLWRVLWSHDVCHWPPRPVVMMVGPRPMRMEAGIQLHETCRHFSEFAVNMFCSSDVAYIFWFEYIVKLWSFLGWLTKCFET